MKIFYTFIFFSYFIFSQQAKAQSLQLNIVIPNGDTTICAGQQVNLQASALVPFLITDFNNGSMGTGWSSTQANPVFNNPCGSGPNGAYLWVGTTSSNNRTLVTNSYNLSSFGGCFIEFYMRYGRVPGSGDCEDPDASDEGVHLQYSTNNGASWTDFPGTGINPVGNLSVTPPFNTTTPGSGGYWPPLSGSSNQSLSTLYHWNKYRCIIPTAAISSNTQFRWAQLNTSSAGFDAWGIDEVIIGCSISSLLWSTGNTTLSDTVVPINTTTYWVQASDANGNTVRDSVRVNLTHLNVNLPDTISNCYQDSILLDGGSGWSSYQWSTGRQSRYGYAKSGGFYTLQVTDVAGCLGYDSVFVNADPSRKDYNLTYCDSFVNPLSNRTHYNSGVIYDTIYNPVSCDTVVMTDLTINRSKSHLVYDTICYEDVYVFSNGDTLSSSGLYHHTLVSNKGCDSLYTLSLTILPEIRYIDTVFICYQESILLSNGRSISAPGLYVDTIQTNHCDSLHQIQLYNYPHYEDSLAVAICSDSSFIHPNGSQINTTGVYTHVFTSQYNCDSIIHYDITVYPTYTVLMDSTICFGEQVHFPNGVSFQSTGTYTILLSSIHGCDSLISFNLSVTDTNLIIIDTNYCEGGYYYLPDGDSTSYSGTFHSNFENAGGCDSTIITHLVHIVKPEIKLTYDLLGCNKGINLTSSVSSGAPPYEYYWFDNSRLNTAHTFYSDTVISLLVTDTNGCSAYSSLYIPKVDSIFIKSLFSDTVNIESNPVKISAISNAHELNWYWKVIGCDSIYNTPLFHYTFPDSGSYQIQCTVEVYPNCIIDTIFKVYVNPLYKLYMPNAFTPGNDDLNNEFGPSFSPESGIRFELIISNRWGRIMETYHNQPWDGRLNGKPAPQGVYIYRLNIKDPIRGSLTKTGKLTLIR
jgi:gliding motility-associated-like protein